VTVALKEYIQRKKQVAIIDLFGKVGYDEDYDYKDCMDLKYFVRLQWARENAGKGKGNEQRAVK